MPASARPDPACEPAHGLAHDPGRDTAAVRALCRWFAANARELPWRETAPSGGRDPYRSLVSEVMLQQTQVSRVLEKFGPFLERFPTIQALAAADEDDVLAMWSGLGYYRRARSLHACAQQAVAEFGGLPEQTEELARLKGIGRYTAGAIASIVHNQPVPIVDGNVERVLLRLEGRELRAGEPQTRAWCWERANELVGRAGVSRAAGVSPAAFNEAMMELGALVCSPKSPGCGRCPLRGACRAFAESKQDRVPLPKARKAKKPLYMACLIVRDAGSRLLLSQRPKDGLWGGLWQAPSLESDTKLTKARVARHFGVAASTLARQDRFTHETTHRSVEVIVYRSATPSISPGSLTDGPTDNSTDSRSIWATPADAKKLAVGSLQSRVIQIGHTS